MRKEGSKASGNDSVACEYRLFYFCSIGSVDPVVLLQCRSVLRRGLEKHEWSCPPRQTRRQKQLAWKHSWSRSLVCCDSTGSLFRVHILLGRINWLAWGVDDLLGLGIDVLEGRSWCGALAGRAIERLVEVILRKGCYLRDAAGHGTISLPGPGNSGLWKVAGDLSHAVDTWTWRRQLWRKRDQLDWAAVSTNVVLGSAELTTLGSDLLQVLLSWSIGIANLKEKALVADWSAMEIFDDLLADVAALEASKTNTTAVSLRVVKNSARDHSVIHEDRSKLSFVHVLWQIGDVEVGRALVTLGLEARVKGLSGEANLVSKLVETTNAQLRVADIKVLGKAEALASTSGSVDDSFGRFNTAKARSISSESLIVGVWVETADVDVAVAVNWVGQALLKSSHVLTWSKDGWDCWWDRWILTKEGIDIDVVSSVLVWKWLYVVVRSAESRSW